MANQRDPNKVSINFYADKEIKILALKYLNSIGSNLSEYLNLKLFELLKYRDYELRREMLQLDGRTKAGRSRIKCQKNKQLANINQNPLKKI